LAGMKTDFGHGVAFDAVVTVPGEHVSSPSLNGGRLARSLATRENSPEAGYCCPPKAGGTGKIVDLQRSIVRAMVRKNFRMGLWAAVIFHRRIAQCRTVCQVQPVLEDLSGNGTEIGSSALRTRAIYQG
jgi:hypothetical protein